VWLSDAVIATIVGHVEYIGKEFVQKWIGGREKVGEVSSILIPRKYAA
jgi:hypothetical protein